MEYYKIEKGIPMPEPRKMSMNIWSRWAMLANNMDVGDSVLVEGWRSCDALMLAFRKLNRIGTSTSEKGGRRVWRVI